jgi:hypothetical protein
MPLTRKIPAVAALAALALPGAAVAKGKPDHAGHGQAKQERRAARHGSGPMVTYVLKGIWSAGSLQVAHGNAHARRAGLVGQTVALDLTAAAAKVKVADANADGVRDLADVQDGDRVLVQARLPRRAPGAAPFAVRKLVDQTHPASGAGDEAADDQEPVEAPAS